MGLRKFVFSMPRSVCFFSVGDIGTPNADVQGVALAMNKYAETNCAPDFILCLGDNFYPSGVASVDDPQFMRSWANVFLGYEKLRVPWKVVLGNHDYMQNPEAQIEFTNHPTNPQGLWQCPDYNYTFTHVIDDDEKPTRIDFFALDTVGCQGHVRRARPSVKERLYDFKENLKQSLAASAADWKIVFAHHPLYTKSVLHGGLGRCLRDDFYTHKKAVNEKGYGFEQVLVDGQVDAYFSGHEHMFQHHSAKNVNYFVCGASGAEPVRLYGGPDVQTDIDWVDETSSNGFVVTEVTRERMVVKFVNVLGEVLKSVEVVH
eukprot:c8180_g1_i1.p1 GENE.c8180_g1_i1~~c8180_g1_i1.p1  ORF type:complete len:317 (+),score=57.03 c8180_g1_i1:1-951(+)